MSVANNTWTLDADLKNGKITFSSNNNNNEMSMPYKNAKDMETDQTLINFIDCCKDGRPTGGTPNAIMMNDLGLFTQKKIDKNWPSKLANYEEILLKKYANDLQAHSWFATKQKMAKTGVIGGKTYGSPLNYQYVLWESGLGPDKYIKHNGDKSTAISTFGSYIDPLSKANTADYGIPQNWPNPNDKLILSEKAMKIFGFKDSKLDVEGAPTTKGKWDDVDYTMTIGCGGVACDAEKQCTINKTEGKKYMDGNGVKGNVLKQGINTDEKIKYIIVKEWGDKTQVLIYLLMIKGDTKYSNAIMVTCDMVVFCLCLTLNIPCVFNGESTSFPGSIPKFQKGESMRRIVHYNGVVEVDKRRLSIYNDILDSNDKYIKMLSTVSNLLENGNTSIEIKLSSQIYEDISENKIRDFFKLMELDCIEINKRLRKRQDEYTFDKGTGKITGESNIMTIDEDEEYIQKNMAIKSIFSTRNTTHKKGEPKVFQLARGINKYCETGGTEKPSFQKYFADKNHKDVSKKHFYEIFIAHFAKPKPNLRGGSVDNRMQFKRGGALKDEYLQIITNGIVVIPVWDCSPDDLFTGLVSTQDEINNSVKDQNVEDRVWYKDRVVNNNNIEVNVCLDFHKLVYNKLCEWVKIKQDGYTIDDAYLLYWRYASANNTDVMPGLPKIQDDNTIKKNDGIFFAHMDKLYKPTNTVVKHENINIDTTAMRIVDDKKKPTPRVKSSTVKRHRKRPRMSTGKSTGRSTGRSTGKSTGKSTGRRTRKKPRARTPGNTRIVNPHDMHISKSKNKQENNNNRNENQIMGNKVLQQNNGNPQMVSISPT